MTFKIRKVLASRIEPGRTVYLLWDANFPTLESAREYVSDFVHARCFDILSYNPKRREYRVVVEHKKAA